MVATSCHYCRADFTDTNPCTRDHIIPKSQGGWANHGNIVFACRLCNQARGAAPYHQYLDAVKAAHRLAASDPKRTGYVRPKYRDSADGGGLITIGSTVWARLTVVDELDSLLGRR